MGPTQREEQDETRCSYPEGGEGVFPLLYSVKPSRREGFCPLLYSVEPSRREGRPPLRILSSPLLD